MQLERLIQKLRWDGPVLLWRKWLARQQARVARVGRRHRWRQYDLTVESSAIPAAFSSEGATRVWPGAADRSWLPEARLRWPEEHAAAARLAEAAAEGRFDHLGSGEVSVRAPDGHVRWHDDFKSGAAFPADRLYLDVPICLPRLGTDIKVPWELSRFQHVFAMLWTDPERYGPVFLEQWREWVEANPAARGVNWACTMDVALRAIAWTAALAAWGPGWDVGTLRAMGVALATHGHFIRDNLEWTVPLRTNHYFSNLVGLAVLGVALEGYRPAEEWAAFAARELGREMIEQFAPDGFDREQSTAYHRLMVELATLGLRASRLSGNDLGPEACERLVAAYRTIAVLTTDAGRGPLVGDNDSGRLFPMVPREDEHYGYVLPLGAEVLVADDLALGDPPPELALVCGPEAPTRYDARPRLRRPAEPRALADTGFFVLGDGADRMIVRCGPLTYRPADGHSHLDYLSFVLYVGGDAIMVDPGQYCYTPWPEWRNRFRYAQSHNTLVIDDSQPCRVFTPGRSTFNIIPEAVPRCLAWEVGRGGGRFVGMHRGYRRLPGGADHERTVDYAAAERRWRVTDRVDLKGWHTSRWYFHLHPDCRAEPVAGGWRLARGGVSVGLRWLGGGRPDGRLEAGWYARGYGRKESAGLLVLERTAKGPVRASFELRAGEGT
ncbi:MAG: alginate lyase family protein [Phycisphaerae bacterium]|nr:alginate lyase family protein [Phycisphaerae bacterium]